MIVTFPLENALIGTPGLQTIRSKSVLGLSSIRMLLQEGTDLYRVRQLVQERMAVETPRLPVVARPPVIMQPLSSLSRMMKIGITSTKLRLLTPSMPLIASPTSLAFSRSLVRSGP
ncbi:MAG: efflux RND transporter permease subunit [Planctomycetaceae bacterium]|nr:efflux RND transporter permease subunit [Planctomycetaceae bacterium]